MRGCGMFGDEAFRITFLSSMGIDLSFFASLTLDYTFYFFTDFPLRVFHIKILRIEAFLIKFVYTFLQLYSEHATI
jgi:hypothetical protein